MSTLLRGSLLTAIAIAFFFDTAVKADSSTPPTREGFTPGSNPSLTKPFTMGISVSDSSKGLNADRPLHHRLNQGVN